MTTKALFGLTVVPAAILCGMLLACVSKRIRDLFFVLLVFLAPMIERVDVNFVSREWYRGTARGFQFSVLDILALSLLAGCVLAPRRGAARVYWPASLGIMLVFLLYACFNVAIADPKLFALFELSKMFRGLVVVLAIAFYVRSERELRLFVLTLGVLVCYESLLALKQRYVDGIHRVPGTIDDSNSLSVFLVTTVPVLVAAINSRLPKWLKLPCIAALPLAVVAEILTISRAGIIILALVMFGTMAMTMSYRFTLRKVAIALVVVVGATAITAKSWKTLKARFQTTSLKEEYGHNMKLGRGYYIRIAKFIARNEWFGVGLNNWSYWVSNRYGPRLGYRFVPYKGTDREPSDVVPSGSNVDEAQAAPAHSLAALTAGELGLPGLVLFTLVWLRWLQLGASFLWPRAPDPLQRLGVGIFFGFCGNLMQSFTEWVFRQSPIYFVFHILLGVLLSLCYAKRQARRALATQAAPHSEARIDDEPLAIPSPRPAFVTPAAPA